MLTAVYAGNIGEGQALHLIIPELARQLEHRVRFRIIGDGGRKEQLRAAVSKAGVRNVEFVDPVKRDSLISAYSDADVLFLHLNDCDAFRKVLPSKLFEYAASGKPVWAGVSGYAAQFIRTQISNAVVFDPCDAEGAARSLEMLRFEDTSREEFVLQYARAKICRELAGDVIDAAVVS
jgi:glycosyltransferase involved in cell wall biosynthesis